MITDSLNKLKEIKSDIKEAIINKGVEVGDKFEEYAAGIDSIKGGERFVVPGGMKFGYSGITEFPSDWDWSEVEKQTDWNHMFDQCKQLSKYPTLNTSEAQSLSYSFANNSNMAELPNFIWNTGNVTNMSYMFQNCSLLKTIDIGDWNIDKVTTMGAMFGSCSKLRTVSAINVPPGVTDGNSSYNSPFYSCDGLRNFGGLIGWKNNLYLDRCYCLSYESLQNIINGLAEGVSSKTLYLNQHCANMLEEDDIALATSKGWTISPAKNITGPVVVTNTAQTSSTYQINKKLYDFSQYTGAFSFSSTLQYFEGDMSSATSLYNMFAARYSLVEVILTGTDNVTNMERMFNSCSDLENFSISSTASVKNMRYMFAFTKLKKADLTGWDLRNVTDMEQMFASCVNLTEVRMDSELNPDLIAVNMFLNITTNGTFYYNPDYDYSKIIAVLPSTWTAVPLK